jgi:hypothetical protein
LCSLCFAGQAGSAAKISCLFWEVTCLIVTGTPNKTSEIYRCFSWKNSWAQPSIGPPKPPPCLSISKEQTLQKKNMTPSYRLYFSLRVILPPTTRSSNLFLSFSFSKQTPLYTSPVARMCHIAYLNLSYWFDHPSHIWWGVQIIKLLIM